MWVKIVGSHNDAMINLDHVTLIQKDLSVITFYGSPVVLAHARNEDLSVIFQIEAVSKEDAAGIYNAISETISKVESGTEIVVKPDPSQYN